METPWDVIVVGAGLAGLTAGALAAGAGAATLVVEAHQPGGRARTVDKDGFVLNMGAHALYTGGPGMAVLRSLGVNPQGAPPPLDRYRVLANGDQHLLPTGPRSLLRTNALGRRSKAQFAKMLTMLPRLEPARFAGTSVSEWLGAYELRPDAEAVVRALLRLSTYASNFDDFSADAAIRQLQIGAQPGVLYLHGGWSQLTDQLRGMVQVRSGIKVTGVEPAAGRVQVTATDSTLVARQVILAAGPPVATRALLPADPGWGDLGGPVTAACLDLGLARVPEAGYLLGVDAPLYASVQSPPARQAPDGGAVVGAVRYGARDASADRADLERHLGAAGVPWEDAMVSRFLAKMVVAGAAPRAGAGGLSGRPAVTASGISGVHLAGDWVGDQGILADASLASARTAARLAVRALDASPTMAV